MLNSPPRCFSRPAAGLAVCLAASLTGCGEEEIRTYTAPQDAPRPALTLADPGGAPASAIDLHWSVPPDWRASDAPQSFTVASYEAGPADAPAIITVTRLSGEGGGALENINRWRGQIGLPPVAELSGQPMEGFQVGPFPIGVVDLVGEAGPGGEPVRIVGALLPREDRNETWFFKMMGASNVLEPVKPGFLAMLRSVHPAGPGHHHHDHNHGHHHDHDHDHADGPAPATGAAP